METQYFSKNYFRDLFRPGGIEDEDGQMKKIRTLDGGLVTDPVEGVSGEEQYLRQIGQYVSGYLRMLQDKLQDSVPKAIVHKVGCFGVGVLLYVVAVVLDVNICIFSYKHIYINKHMSPPSQLVSPSKERLLEELHTYIMASDTPNLQVLLCEDENVMKKREMIQQRLSLMNRAAAELSTVTI